MSRGLHVEAEVRYQTFTLRAAFGVPPGLTVLFGPSGAGKTLTLQAIAGLVPLAAGQIALAGRTLADPARGIALPSRQRRVGYVPQHYALFPHLTVAENVAYALPAPHHPWDRETRARRAARVAELLALVRLPGYERRWPRELSGGQAQRVALARALAAEPEALLLDEPLGALDAPTRAAVQDDLRAVVLASGVPALVVTHDLAEARALGDRLAVLVEGRVAAEGAVAEVLAAPPTAEVALLLGWRNVSPVRTLERVDGAACVRLACGQALRVPAAAEGSAPTEGSGWALALRADRLEATRDATCCASGRGLAGVLRSASDAGAYYTLRVALEGAMDDAPDLIVTCSPREWARLALRPGDRLAVAVPEDAARLVRSQTAAPQALEPEVAYEPA
jgi:molybdate transport system ATP-binding protein